MFCGQHPTGHSGAGVSQGHWQRGGSFQRCQCGLGLGDTQRLAARERDSCPRTSRQGPGVAHRWVDVPLVALLAMAALGPLLSGERGQDRAVPNMAGGPADRGRGAARGPGQSPGLRPLRRLRNCEEDVTSLSFRLLI